MLGSQKPRIQSVPAYVSSAGAEAVELAAMAGLFLDEWQQGSLKGSLGERQDGKWAAFEVGVNVARQNGKGGLIEARELAGLFLVNDRLIIHSAHQFDTASEAFQRMDALLEASADLSRRVLKVSRSHGSEGFTLKSGQRLRYRTRTKGGGRGFTADLLILDEAMILPEAFHGALLPTLSAKSITGNPQVWYTGSAVDQFVHEDGRVFTRIRERGMKGDPGLAYFEWSVDAESPEMVPVEQLSDPAVWAVANPGLGIRISVEHVRNEQASMDKRTFAVERLGVGDWPNLDADAGRLISLEQWQTLVDTDSEPVDPVCFAFDTSPDRAWSTVSVAGKTREGMNHVETVEHHRGTGWVLERLLELGEKHAHVGFVCDGRSPAGALIPELEKAGLEVIPVTSSEYAQGCGMFYDKAEQQTLRHRGLNDPDLSAAVRSATTRPLGEAWAWSRKTPTDISPLVAATLALWGFLAREPEPEAAAPRVIDLSQV